MINYVHITTPFENYYYNEKSLNRIERTFYDFYNYLKADMSRTIYLSWVKKWREMYAMISNKIKFVKAEIASLITLNRGKRLNWNDFRPIAERQAELAKLRRYALRFNEIRGVAKIIAAHASNKEHIKS